MYPDEPRSYSTPAYGPGGPDMLAKVARPMDEAIGYLNSEVSALHAIIDRLSDRLLPALRPVGGLNAEASTKEPASASPLVEQIDSNRRGVNLAIARISNLVDSLVI